MTFNWGALLGWAAVRGGCDWGVVLPLYASGVCWTLVYDTIYAHQDKRDDARVGIRSTALTFGAANRTYLAGFAAANGALLAAAGEAPAEFAAAYAHDAGLLLRYLAHADAGTREMAAQLLGILTPQLSAPEARNEAASCWCHGTRYSACRLCRTPSRRHSDWPTLCCTRCTAAKTASNSRAWSRRRGPRLRLATWQRTSCEVGRETQRGIQQASDAQWW